MSPLNKSPFSHHFNVLTLMGVGILETRDEKKLLLYVIYKVTVLLVSLCGVYGLVLDFFQVITDLKKMTWNLCVTAIFVGTLVKNFQVLQKNQIIRSLRMKLHRDAESRNSPGDIAIHKTAVKELKLLRISFYGTATIFLPIWILVRYIGYHWGIRELPIPLRVPYFIDLEDDLQFHALFAMVAWSAMFGLIIAMETELAMYGILIQISREYRFLLNDIPLINDLYSESSRDFTVKEVNPYLRGMRTKNLVKKFSARQNEIIEYTKAFEGCYNKPLLQEFFSISVIIIALALQCLWEAVDLSGHFIYQIGYLFINVADMFLICWFSTKLKTQCLEIGQACYSTLWYRMTPETRRDIALIIMRSQHPPKITTGKIMELSLAAFTNIMRNLYSWLAMIRQFDSSY